MRSRIRALGERKEQMTHTEHPREGRSAGLAALGVWTALALILSWVESILPVPFPVPGMKLGLTNLVTVILLYSMGAVPALLVTTVRIVLSGFLFGNPVSIIYSLGGGLLSFAVMAMLKRTERFRILTVSLEGGVFHAVGQLLVASVFVSNGALLLYLPVLSASGALTGALIGLVAEAVLQKIPWRISK